MARLPEKVGKYKILSLVGKGGMGLVYAAEHPTLKRKIILKKLTIRDKESRERFRLEADLMMDLRSDYIVDMYDHFREGSSYYIAMEFIEGITLEELIAKQGPLDYELIVYIMSCTARALEYIHNRGVIHRDIKPSNIYISRSGEVKLGDFGIASSASRDIKITDSGSAMGTPAYMAPEQFNDSSSVDKRADIFSFGVTLYESLSGQKPFLSKTYTELKHEISRGKYKKLTLKEKRIPLFLKWMIFRALMVNPLLRQQDIKAINHRFSVELKKVSFIKIKEKLAGMSDSGKKNKKTLLTEIVVEKSKKKPGRAYGKWLMAALFFIVSGFILSGGVYRLIGFKAYGGLSMFMVPASEDGHYSLYKESSGDLALEKTGKFNKKGSISLYLKKGSYCVRIDSGSHVSWRSLYIPSFEYSHGEVMEITVLSSPMENFPLDLKYSVKDRFSGRDLTASTTVKLLNPDGWQIMDDSMVNSLKTGRSFDFRFDSSGYETGDYSINVDYHQTSLQMDVLLSPIAVPLTINSFEGEISLNGRDQYFSLETLTFENLNEKNDIDKILMLNPGKYAVSIESDGFIAEKTINLVSGTEAELTVVKNQENGIKIELD